jgi:hypothetical protein
MNTPHRLLALAVAALLSSHAFAQTEVKAVLAGHAALPASTTIKPPKDAHAFFATAGKFATPNRQRTEIMGSQKANTFVGDPKFPRASGGALPVAGQAVQGFSGIVALSKDEFLVLTDNGFGSKLNSHDALLMVHHVKTNWGTGQVQLKKTTFLHDPDRKIPFAIQNEATTKRYLTGVDFDIESIQVVGNEWWIGEEFGPYVLRTTAQGKVLGVIETKVGDKNYRGPDHYMTSRLPNLPGDAPFEVRRSGGFEPMGKSPDGRKLYPMFEWPLYDSTTKTFEKHNGRTFTRIFELDVGSQTYTSQQWKYKFEEDGNVAADLQLIDATTALVIERDDGSEGIAPACPNEARTDCFTRPAKFKRIYKIDMAQIDADGFVRKVAYIDLTKIDNPKLLAKRGPNEAVFALPHLGPEGLSIVDADHIVVVNDNNFPYSSGREIGKPDDNEITLLDIRALIQAK